MERKIELSPRLAAVGELIPEGLPLVDVGTDHAYLPAALVQAGHTPCAVAADLRQGPLSRAKETVRECGLNGKIGFRLCDGLTGIRPEEAGCIAIAGMGGETIAHILSAAPWVRERAVPLVLQPMSTQRELRQWLGENGYTILREKLAQEGETIYTILLVQVGEMPPMTAAELEAGRLDRDPLRGALLEKLSAKARRAAAGLERARQEGADVRRQALLALGNELDEMKKEWETWHL